VVMTKSEVLSGILLHRLKMEKPSFQEITWVSYFVSCKHRVSTFKMYCYYDDVWGSICFALHDQCSFWI